MKRRRCSEVQTASILNESEADASATDSAQKERCRRTVGPSLKVEAAFPLKREVHLQRAENAISGGSLRSLGGC